MIECPNCKTIQEAMKFCGNCGTLLPNPKKKCPQCNTEWPNEQKFCGECGFNFFADNKSSQKSAISLGNDNMIAGDFIGQKEDYHIAGSATFVRNEDETKKLKKCEICGSLDAVTVGYECNSCGKYVCEDCFDKSSKQCKECSGKKDVTVKLSTKSFLPEESRYILEDAYNNFMNRNETSYRFNETKKLLTKYPDNEKVIDAFLQMAEFVDYKSALNFIEEFNKKVENGQEDLLCVHLSSIRLMAKMQQRDDMEVEIEKVKLKWPEYKNIKLYEAMYHILMSEQLNDELATEKLNKANELIQSLNFDEENKIERSYVYYVKCLYDNITTKEDCEWSDISEKYDLYPRILLNSLRKVTVSQNDECDFTTISQAIENSPAGSHLWICSGEYKEKIMIEKKLTLEGIDEDVFIISETEEPCIKVCSENTVGIINLNLKNTNENNTFALLVEESSCAIVNCTINDSRAGIYLKNSPDIYIGGCSFDNNTVSIMLENSIAEIEDTEVKNSTGPQITVRLGSSATIENSKIISGEKKGIIVDNSELVIKKSEISDNTILAVEARSNGKVILEECSATNESYCWYHDDGVIECNNCTNFIIEDENSDKAFNREIEVSSSNLKSEIEFERGVTYCENEDFDSAIECFNKAIELNENNDVAWYNLGLIYCEKENYDKSFQCYSNALELNPDNKDALYNIAMFLYYGCGVQQDCNKAFELFSELTNKNEENYDALYMLAECYYDGRGCVQDRNKAFKLLKNIVNFAPEHLDAQYLLGYMYYEGVDIEEDPNLAFSYFKKAAENNHVRAQYLLGWCYYHGFGCYKNNDQASNLFFKASNAGDIDATFFYGKMLCEGEATFGNRKNSEVKGRKMVENAAKEGCLQAKEYLKNTNKNNLPSTINNSPTITNSSSNNSKNSCSGEDLLAGAAIGAGAALLGAAAWGVGKWLFGDDKKK